MTADRARSMAVRHGGVFLDGAVCEPLWRFLRDAVGKHQRDGASVRPELREALEALRLAAMDHLSMSANGHPNGHLPVLEPLSETQMITTGELAVMLGVSDRQARRIACAEGVMPPSRGTWRRADALAMVERRQADAR
jgi:hypothetical protein